MLTFIASRGYYSTGCPILNGPKVQNRQNSSRGSRFLSCIFFCFGLVFEIIAKNPQFWKIISHITKLLDQVHADAIVQTLPRIRACHRIVPLCNYMIGCTANFNFNVCTITEHFWITALKTSRIIGTYSPIICRVICPL